MICPNCGHDNLPGSEECSSCLQDLTQLDRPTATTRVERSLMEDTVGSLNPKPVITVSLTATVREAMLAMLDHGFGALPVVDAAGRLRGILSERDLVQRAAGIVADFAEHSVSEFMTPNPETITMNDTLALALHKMDVGGYRHLPVVDQDRAVAMISVRDMLRHITQLCKEC